MLCDGLSADLNNTHKNNPFVFPRKSDSEKNNIKPWGNSQGSLQVQWEKKSAAIFANGGSLMPPNG